MSPEQMFNMLNSWRSKGKNPPMVCKFLDSVSAFSHGFVTSVRRLFYPLERTALMNLFSPGLGLRIAFSISRPSTVRIPGRKG
jgi:hypothetical protein